MDAALILLQSISVILAMLGNVTLIKKMQATFAIWGISNVAGGIVEFSAHLYGLAFLQVFFLVMNVICWIRWGEEKRISQTGKIY